MKALLILSFIVIIILCIVIVKDIKEERNYKRIQEDLKKELEEQTKVNEELLKKLRIDTENTENTK